MPECLLSLTDVDLSVTGRQLVTGLSWTLEAGQCLVVVGANGAGKTTLLRTLAGLRRPDRGQVSRPSDPPGMHFQEGALWPHMSVAQHLAFVDVANDKAWRAHVLELFDLGELASARPGTLSGGERVRLSLARAVAGRPRWLLLDEPLAHLDPVARARVRDVLPGLVSDLGAACVTVSHDPDDALLFGKRLLHLPGDGSWWLGETCQAIMHPEDPALAIWAGRGSVLSGSLGTDGEVDWGLTPLQVGAEANAGPEAEAVTEAVTEAGPEAETETETETETEADTAPPQPTGSTVLGWLDADAVTLAADTDRDALCVSLVAPDRTGGGWVRTTGGHLLRCQSLPPDIGIGESLRISLRAPPTRLDSSTVGSPVL